MSTVNLKYLRVTGTVGSADVDLTFAVPVENIMLSIPRAVRLLTKHLPMIIKAGLELKTAIDAVGAIAGPGDAA